jgi:hypothetical protein
MNKTVNIDNLIHDLAVNEMVNEMDDFFQDEFNLYVNGDEQIKEIKPEYLDLYQSYIAKYQVIVTNNIVK